MRSEEKAKESCGMQLSDFVVPPGSNTTKPFIMHITRLLCLLIKIEMYTFALQTKNLAISCDCKVKTIF